MIRWIVRVLFDDRSELGSYGTGTLARQRVKRLHNRFGTAADMTREDNGIATVSSVRFNAEGGVVYVDYRGIDVAARYEELREVHAMVVAGRRRFR